ncbi:MAG: hypothetical protein GON13_00045 [Nanoarchaeota archaeon]|nr:hypothetical protein [Nanoarchaeota archaeon]
MPYNKLSLNLETSDLKQIKVDVTSLIILICLLSGISFIMLLNAWSVASIIILIGVISYSLALVFLFERAAEKKFGKDFLWKFIRVLFLVLMGFMIFMIVQSAMALKGVINASDFSQKVYGLVSVGVLVVSILSLPALQNVVKKRFKKSKYFLLILPLTVFFIFGGVSITGAVSLNETASTLSTIDQIMGTVSNVTSFISEQQISITESLGISDTQTMILTGVVFLIALMLAARFIETIIKWLILILIGIFLVMLI